LPLTLLVSMALLVRVGTERYAVPLQSIREVVQPKPEELQDLNGRCVLNLREETVEVHSLAHLLGIEALHPTGPTWIIIVRTAVGILGLTIDELLGRQEIVIKSLGALRPFVESCFMGASIDPEGQVVLVLDVGRLMGSFENREAASSGLARAEVKPPGSDQPVAHGHPGGSRILLIDDSLSIRKFVGKMLEGVGYQVETANDGEEGLRRAAERSYDLIITDLEMPKLNGYEVIHAMRRRSHTKATPILVMTTRAGEKHRQMAASVGASGYITKPVEERALILEVNQWISQSAGSQT
jgi:chemosensory pili system protein ChpA (sensor histidine kinase/response regulator)